jgi:hypothetical protein
VKRVATKRRTKAALKEIDAVVVRLREFIRFGYVTGLKQLLR